MGIITLESELDSALRVLDCRLSLTTDNIACTIYTYRMSLLKGKIAKIHKKLVTPVSSPLSVSPNKHQQTQEFAIVSIVSIDPIEKA